MEYEFKYGDKEYAIIITDRSERNNPGPKVSINGITIPIEASPVSQNSFLISFDGKNRQVYVASSENEIFVCIDGRIIRLGKALSDEQKFSHEGFEFGAKDEITTPMPGKIVKILVAEGERVALKQPLVIVESMKMENEIKSPTDGTVRSIHFKAGDLVEPGQTIIKINPE